MKWPLLLCAVGLSLQGLCANIKAADTSARPVGRFYQASHKMPSLKTTGNPIKEKGIYSKGKGWTGFALGVLLGPIGLISAHLFSRNKAVRDKAVLGFGVWLLVSFVISSIVTRQSVGDILLQLLQGILTGLGSS